MYYLVRPIARIAIKAFYRKIYISHLERIPRNKPVILAANHPTAFMEPCIMAIFLPQPVYFLVRGDFFVQKFYRFLLRSLKMLPIYRIIDAGYSGLKHNFATFAACADSLAQGCTIMIFPEGNTTHEKRMRPVQKGLARIVAGTYEKYPDLEDIFVIPLGVNYTYAERPRSEVLIDVGEPIPTKALFVADPRRAIVQLTTILKHQLEERVIIVEKHADDALAEQLLLMARSRQASQALPVSRPDRRPLETELAVTTLINTMAEGQKEQLGHTAAAYFSELQALGLDDAALIRPVPCKAFHRLAWWLSAPLAWAGRLFCAPPMRLAWHIKNTRVVRIEFYAPVLLAVSMGTFVVYFLLWLLAAALSRKWALIPMAAVLGALGYFGILHREWGERIAVARRVQQLGPREKIRLMNMREEVVKQSGSDLI
ncbi:MAG: hypothetical protein RL386_1421 [Bacteroidota bacterium]|jgi:glycerol-3-phosphate O-acyltransferase/dihydroxyacetone phosphate acyltransferase